MREIDLWHAFRAAAMALMAEDTPERRAAARTAHAAWVRAYCPESAEREIAAYASRMEADCAA